MPEITGFVACPSLEPCEWDEKRWAEEGDRELSKGFRHARDPRYILRPEAIESIFYLYRATGQEELRDIAWKMFQNVVKATETGLAYSAIKDVRAKGETEKEDSMEVCCHPHDLGFIDMTESADTAHAELLDGGDIEVFLLNLFAAGLDQPR
jgi:mannosyl-oligosaccharide alpha-1,2-mannosidase